MGHIINLLSIAYADGSITEEEKNLICNISDNLGLTNEEFNHCLATWQETDEDILKVSMPEAEEDRIAFLKNMTLLMMIDGEIDENERQYISNAAEEYGFNGEQAVNYLIKQIQEEYGGGEENEEEEDELFEGVDDENRIDSVWYDLESKDIEEAFETIYASALRNEKARNIFLVIPGIDTRLFRLTEEQIEKVKKTAEKGYPLAKYVLGRYYQVVKPEGSTMGDAGALLKAAADDGIADAYWALATMVEQGYYGPVNTETYDSLMGSALEKGCGMAIRKQLLDIVYGLHGMKANPKKAIDTVVNKIYINEEAEKTYPYFYAVMGDAYKEMGNESKADECYEKAVDLGYFEASASRFVNKISGPNAEFNREMFNFLLDFGCDGKDPNSFLYRALEGVHFYENKDVTQQQVLTMKIKEDLEKAVDLGQGRAAFYLGYCHYYGKGVTQDYEKAFLYFSRAASFDEGDAINMLGLMYRCGDYVNANERFSWEILKYGRRVIPWDLNLDSHPSNLLAIGQGLAYGWGCDINIEEAEKYLKEAERVFEYQVKKGRKYAKEGLRKTKRNLEVIESWKKPLTKEQVMDKDNYIEMSSKRDVYDVQIPISKPRFDYLVNHYNATDHNSKWVMIPDSLCFLIYDRQTRYCIFKGEYQFLENNINDNESAFAVITKFIINKDKHQRPRGIDDDFKLFSDLIEKDL